MKVSSKVSIELALLKKKERRRKSIFDSVYFSMQTAILEGVDMCTGSISLVGYEVTVRRVVSVIYIYMDNPGHPYL